MIYKSNFKWLLYKVDSDGIKHIVREYNDKPTYNEIENLFLINPISSYNEPYKSEYIKAFNDLLDGRIVEIDIFKKKRFILQRNEDVNYF